MEQCTTIAALREYLRSERRAGRRVGWIGTSGALHEGHLSLIRRSAGENDVTVMYWGGAGRFDWMESEIVYERDFARDMALAASAGLDAIFVPDNADFFPRQPMTVVALPAMSAMKPPLEDPAHLDLIAMVMAKLFNIFGESRAYFGEKDWQQLAMFVRLAQDLCFPVDVIGCPTVRHEDGVAVSSRNSKLTPSDREVAPVLIEALQAARSSISGGERRLSRIRAQVEEHVGRVGKLAYFVAVDAATLAPVDPLEGEIRLLASMDLGGIRLVDNLGVTVTG